MQKTHYLLLIIYTLFSQGLSGQNLKLIVDGKNDAETKIIDSLNYLRTHIDYSSVKAELDSVQKTLSEIGYIENLLEGIDRINDSTFIASVYLKKKYNTIYIYYNSELVNLDIINNVSNNINDDYFTIPISETKVALNYINSKIAENGFPFTTLKLSNIKIKDQDNLQSQLIISTENNKRMADNIIIKGYKKFPKTFIKHYLKIKSSDVFDLADIEKKTNLLNDLNFANQIKAPEVLFTKDSTTLYLYIEKIKSNSFDGFLGFGTNEDTGKLEFDGYLNLNLNNNLNYGESFNLIYKSDENEQKTFDARISMPYLFGTPIGTELQLNIFKKDSSFTTVNQKARIFYQINSKNKVYAGLTSTQSNNLLSTNSVTLIDDYDSSNFSIAYQFTSYRTNSILFPFNSSLYLETGFGKRENRNSTEKQNNVNFDAFKIFNLNQKNSIYLRLSGASLFSDNYLENELLRFGGINSIRGFEENSLLATLYGVINSEYRLQVSNSLFIHSILDAGYLENKLTSQKEKLYGFGFGFGLFTKTGLLKFNYANGKNENQKFKFSNSKIHISLIAAF